MQILNQPTEPTTTTIKTGPLKGVTFYNGPTEAYTGTFQELATLPIFLIEDPEITSKCSDQLAYWLYNKDVPIPKLPKCMSSRVHSDRRLWGNGKKVKTPPVIDGGWMKENT